MDQEGGIITLPSWGITLMVPRGALREPVEISISALRNSPQLDLTENEMLISAGIECSPPGLRFDLPVKITIPHCLQYSNLLGIKILLHTTDSHKGLYERKESKYSFSILLFILMECIKMKRHISYALQAF